MMKPFFSSLFMCETYFSLDMCQTVTIYFKLLYVFWKDNGGCLKPLVGLETYFRRTFEDYCTIP